VICEHARVKADSAAQPPDPKDGGIRLHQFMGVGDVGERLAILESETWSQAGVMPATRRMAGFWPTRTSGRPMKSVQRKHLPDRTDGVTPFVI
jgi:hypothetical protein